MAYTEFSMTHNQYESVHNKYERDAPGYGLDGPGIESRWGGKIFRTCADRPWGPPSLLHNGYRIFPGELTAIGA